MTTNIKMHVSYNKKEEGRKEGVELCVLTCLEIKKNDEFNSNILSRSHKLNFYLFFL